MFVYLDCLEHWAREQEREIYRRKTEREESGRKEEVQGHSKWCLSKIVGSFDVVWRFIISFWLLCQHQLGLHHKQQPNHRRNKTKSMGPNKFLPLNNGNFLEEAVAEIEKK